ncbi:FimD/PapC N-terminal domain-containing protein [Escherichia coli]|uniref:FimD/PapC N-terminal domain-containing protein n=1 Tax=Escherichia coli TaxID=562 RepID=UPI000A5732D2|nr:FimD/PapC N-terminal domain-containing protein [Escherichia coli]
MFFSLKENTLFRLSALSLALFSSFSFAADEAELNLDFLRGVTSAPSVLKSNSAYPAGQYMVDVIVNQESMGKMPLTISQLEDENNALCLSAEWLNG